MLASSFVLVLSFRTGLIGAMAVSTVNEALKSVWDHFCKEYTCRQSPKSVYISVKRTCEGKVNFIKWQTESFDSKQKTAKTIRVLSIKLFLTFK